MSVSGDTSGGMCVISGLTPSTTYSIQVVAETSGGIGAYSDPLIAKTNGEEFGTKYIHIWLYNILPLAILSVSFVSLLTTIDSLTFSWILADGLTAADYTISYSNTDCPSETYDDITSSGIMYTLTGLEEGTDYSITVTVSLSDGGTGEDNLTATTMTAG